MSSTLDLRGGNAWDMSRKRFYADLKEFGESKVRERVLAGYYGRKKREWAEEWLDTLAGARVAERHRKSMRPVWIGVVVTVAMFLGSCGKNLMALLGAK